MKIITLKLFFVLVAISCISAKANAQTKLSGKRYVAQVGATCKDGVVMLWTYCILNFKKDSVVVSLKVVESVIPEKKGMYEHMYDYLTKTYKWNVKNNVLTIENYIEFNKMTIQKSTLIGKDAEMKSIIFNQEFLDKILP